MMFVGARLLWPLMIVAIFFVGALPMKAFAQTSCNAANRFTLNWDNITPKTNLGVGARNYTVTNTAGASVVVTMSFTGDTTHYIDSGYGQTPNISNQNEGGIANGEFTLFLAADFAGRASNMNLGANVAAVNFAFSTPVREVTFRVMDIDYANAQFRDWIQVGGSNGASTYIPNISTPYGRNNTSNPGVTAPGVAYVGPGTVSTASIANGQIVGTGISALDEDYGNITAVFPAPVTQVEVRYANGPSAATTGTAGIQSIAIHDLSFCPLPVVSIAKSSVVVTDSISGSNPKAIPGADIDYTITITNTGGSTVDLNSQVIADLLPDEMTFYNGDIDTVTAGTQNFVFSPGTSGLTLAAGNITYSNNNGSTYAYTPAAGYDANANAVRFAPQGTMAANSSASVRFRMRVK